MILHWLRSGAADDRAEADKVCRALLEASVVMRLGGLVYLRPDDVADVVVHVRSRYLSWSSMLLSALSRPNVMFGEQVHLQCSSSSCPS